jgi:transposase
VIVIDRFYPSSKTCSGCGTIHEITLRDRVLSCGCGLKMNRDLNAAINIAYTCVFTRPRPTAVGRISPKQPFEPGPTIWIGPDPRVLL